MQVLAQEVGVGVLNGEIGTRQADALTRIINAALLPAAVAREASNSSTRKAGNQLKLTMQHKNRLLEIEVSDGDEAEADRRQVIDQDGRLVQ